MTDYELRALISESPAKGYRALFEQYFNYVYAIVYRILRDCGTHADAEECVADTFADVMQRLNEVGEDSLKAYIGTAAKHKALNASRVLRQQQNRTVPLDSVQEISAMQSVEEAAEQDQLRQILLEKITALGEPDTTILIHKYYYNRKSGDIARIVGLTPAAVRKRCTRAIKRLKHELSDWNLDW